MADLQPSPAGRSMGRHPLRTRRILVLWGSAAILHRGRSMLSHATSPMIQGTHWRTLVRSEKLALLVDLDGTLVDFAPTPEEAVLDADAVGLLKALVELDVRVVIVSGRPRSSIESLRALRTPRAAQPSSRR
jgi:hypothetical protein